MELLDQHMSALSANDTASLARPIMHFVSTALLLGSVALQAVLGRSATDRQGTLLRRSVDSFIDTESPIALHQLLCNIGAHGCNVKGAGPGVVIASPSTENPNYFYTWTRDSSLVFKSLAERFVNHYDAGLQLHIEQFVASQAKLQGVSGPSGSLSDGQGLGEPKFNANLTAFVDNWGRPQRDGPPLRAIALITYANWLIQNDYSSTASTILWPIVQNDLNYVAQYWNQTGFDLWEEVNGSSFFTISSQYRALVEGSALATALGKPGSSYSDVAPHILCFLQSFWVPSAGYIDANINVHDGRTGKDANTILGSIHVFDAKLECDAATFQPCSDKALSNHKVTVDSFRGYKINRGVGKGKAVAVGRYIEDVYFGGHPWYLTTLAAAEQLYDSLYVWKKAGSITVTDISLAFFRDLVPGVSKGTHSSGTSAFSDLLAAVSAYADGFVDVVATYIAPNGSMSEQFDKDDGHPLSARDLTWSYAAFLTAAARRAGIVPPPWANIQVKSMPSTCSATSVVGSYSAATATSFPPSQTPKTGAPPPTTTSRPPSTPTTPPGGCQTATSVAVTFEQLAKTEYGQTIKLVGDTGALGDWKPNKAVSLDASAYTPNKPLWKGTLSLKAGQVVKYKYIKVNSKGSLTWERDPDHTFTVPRTCATTTVRSDKWQY
ncbi:glycosyl hydrolases family 15 domain-containing protein [Hirsutella rhossiliensis]|uniref:Glucoamylase n=1 Tax=Hirsutella rhossiliensis TaxID=111463 RepID=A0A9P8N6T4_9HYPO|nr:glycosyl hydrolases family 15 domain-containing protein [Hirsutella rhossiliensis]KAH0967031.1 glycosyl hydrolases family 15 domain-containing protein [Hirsutella rhossiliensis]